MQLLGSTYTRQKLMRQCAIAAMASLCLAPLTKASQVEATQNNLAATVLSKSPNSSLIAQGTSVCPTNSGGSLFVSAETASFLLYICGGDNPNTYVGIAKKDGAGITLPLRSYTRNQFVAVNGDTTYTLTRTELIVTQRGRVILKQKATWKR